MEPVTEPPPLRRNRDFMILWTGEAVSKIGTSMSVLVFPLIGYAITHSTALAGLATTAVLLGRVLAGLPAGALVDRSPRGRVLLGARVCGVVLYGSLAAATLAHHLTLAHLIVVGFLSGVSDSFFGPAASAAVRTVVPKSQLPAAYSQNQARQHAADLIGPPLGGALYSVARGLPFLIDAISYVVSALAITRIRTPLPAPEVMGERRSLLSNLTEGVRFVWKQTAIRAIMLWGSAFNLSIMFVLVAVTLRLVQAGTHPAAIGLIETIAAAAGLLGAMAAPWIMKRARTGAMTIATGLILAAVMAPMAWTTNVAVIGALLAVGIFLVPANNAGISAYMVSIVPDRLQGRVISAGGFMADGLQPLAPVLAGVLVGSAGGFATTIAGSIMLVASLSPLLSSSAIRGLGRPDSWAEPDPAAVESPV